MSATSPGVPAEHASAISSSRPQAEDVAVSIVIPTYNRAAVLGQCLLALQQQRQTTVPFEVIVVDDGSTDATTALVQDLLPRLDFSLRLTSQENQGPAAARNKGVQLARGSLVLFLGDDVLVLPGHLDHMWTTYQAYPEQERAVLGPVRYRRDCIPTPFGRWLDSESTLQFGFRDLQPGVPLSFKHFYTSNILVRRDAILDVGGFNTLFQSAANEDCELGYRLGVHGLKLYFCPAAMAEHLHPVTVKSAGQRMRAVGRSVLELRRANPVLFAILHPDAEHLIERPSPLRRAARRLCSGPLLELLAHVDGELRWPAPGVCYELALRCSASSEVDRLLGATRAGNRCASRKQSP